MQSVLKSIRPIFNQTEQIARVRRRRPKVTDATILRRKEIKKLRHFNIYSTDHTGERSYHPWMTSGRIRSLMLSYQDLQNRHRHTIKFDPKDQKELIEKSTEYSQYRYWVFLHHQQGVKQLLEERKQFAKSIESLPYHLKKELDADYKANTKHPNRPELLEDYNLYYEQILRIYPDDFSQSIQVGKRIQNIINEKLGENE
ncbi:hypothetical protein PPERSA_06525 [Pseudocohnilembus persalinus]|uniref:Uncharacterized protein n=1 Tax=Pseudocohnilembus persalinus TaxID=266149 RepID=A0A0V0QRJ8_PSEPJ|nr:hypothetical protein PPERSA_06525 [Pseudocohnilembus persalinus]|eukprot:KRX04891.1 hypothetical protein PPERSA_06525 [Pseudocohnilembus persalinus]